MSSGVNIDPPESIKQTRQRIRELQSDIEVIEHQLADPAREKKSGGKMSPSQWRAWRKNALKARNMKAARLRDHKAWLRYLIQERRSAWLDVDPGDCESVVEAANNLIQRLQERDGVSLSEEEQAVANLVRDHVLGV